MLTLGDDKSFFSSSQLKKCFAALVATTFSEGRRGAARKANFVMSSLAFIEATDPVMPRMTLTL